MRYDKRRKKEDMVMKYVYIPSNCPKCENEIHAEKNHDHSGAVYCKKCDFLLPLSKEELLQIEDLYENL